jgi:hypothetical protein
MRHGSSPAKLDPARRTFDDADQAFRLPDTPR